MNCRYCGAQNDGDAIFCGQCGYQLKDDETVANSPYDIVDTSASTSPVTSDDYYQRGIALYNLEKYKEAPDRDIERCEQAIRDFEEAIRINPSNVEAHIGKANALFLVWEDFEGLVRDAFDEALQIDPNNIEALLGYADAVVRTAKCTLIGNELIVVDKNERALLKAALSLYDKVTGIDPNNAEAHLRIGNTYSKLGLPVEAASAYQMAKRINPNLRS
jgi:tetratricopeptide (TPR) repeat protein